MGKRGGGRWTGGIGGGWIITMGDGGRASSYSCNSDRPLIYYLSLLSHISFILLRWGVGGPGEEILFCYFYVWWPCISGS